MPVMKTSPLAVIPNEIPIPTRSVTVCAPGIGCRCTSTDLFTRPTCPDPFPCHTHYLPPSGYPQLRPSSVKTSHASILPHPASRSLHTKNTPVSPPCVMRCCLARTHTASGSDLGGRRLDGALLGGWRVLGGGACGLGRHVAAPHHRRPRRLA
eukprot:3700097-Rhodomonas_salina.2